MEIVEINSENKKKIKQIYESSFPKYEKLSFEILEECAKEKNVELSAIVNRSEVIGMQFTVEYEADGVGLITYIMYLALSEQHRNKGYGSQVIRQSASNKTVLLAIDEPVDVATQRRKDFYLRNGMYETGCILSDSGHRYEFMSSKKSISLTDNTLQGRYLNMSSNKEILKEINKTCEIKTHRI